MDIETKNEGAVLLAKPLSGRLDAGNAPEFKSHMVDYILQDNMYIAIDLSEVEFMDSSGLSALLSTLKTIGDRGRLVLFGVCPNVAKLFSITRLDRGVFEIHEDRKSAIQSLNRVA